MRKRDRDRIAKDLSKYHAEIMDKIARQLSGAIWYFENNAEIKGYDFAYGARSYAEHIGRKIKKYLDSEIKRKDKSKKADKKRKFKRRIRWLK